MKTQGFCKHCNGTITFNTEEILKLTKNGNFNVMTMILKCPICDNNLEAKWKYIKE